MEAVKTVLRVTEMVGKIVVVVSIAALLVMLFTTFIDIILRTFFKAPIPGAVEIVRMMMICMCPAFIAALVEKRHISVGVFVDKLGRKGQMAFDTVGYLASAVICALISYQGFMETSTRMTRGDVYTILRIPVWPFMLLFAVSMGLFAISIVIYLVDIYVDKDRYATPPLTETELPVEDVGGV